MFGAGGVCLARATALAVVLPVWLRDAIRKGGG
jgi:hypothetical protein